MYSLHNVHLTLVIMYVQSAQCTSNISPVCSLHYSPHIIPVCTVCTMYILTLVLYAVQSAQCTSNISPVCTVCTMYI